MAIDPSTCKVCGAAGLTELPLFRQLARVTSDCLPFRSGGRLLTCETCGAAQSPADEQWFREIDEIYSSYFAYHQSAGIEQCVPDGSGGALTPRSEVFVQRLLQLDGVARTGKLLDMGCGTGGTLRAFSKRGDWRLFGLELDDRNLRFLTSIDHFEKLYTCSPDELPGGFSLITLVHTLEHFPEPLVVLRSLAAKLAPQGRLFIEVPHAAANPFDYLIADHMLHFTRATLSLLLERAGFAVNCLATDWVPKELSATAMAVQDSVAPATSAAAAENRSTICCHIAWLQNLVEAGRTAAGDGHSFGLFGSSIAATWLCSTLGDSVSFFVDEDSHRIGRVHLNRPIYSPAQVSPGSVVLLPMVPQIASRVAERLRGAPIDLRLPPALPV